MNFYDHFIGFWCLNSDQEDGATCSDWTVQFCCPRTATSECDVEGYSWSQWSNSDTADGTGDWEQKSTQICANPIATKVETINGNDFNTMTHISWDQQIVF